jgi:pimeloyl-ACP methyl ester carboxylesterase
MTGLLIFMATALAALLVLLGAMLAYEMVHPPRHTAGYAIARGLACDPGERGLTFTEWTLDRPDGAQLPVWEITTNSRPAHVDPVTAVFIHGWGHSRIDSLARIDVIRPLVDRIVLYELRGHGESAGCLSHLGDREDNDLIALLDRITPSTINGPPKQKLILVGHSMGAVIGLHTAHRMMREQHPLAGRIAAIIAYGPYCEFHRSLRGRLKVSGYPARPITDLALLLHRLRGIRPSSLQPSELHELNTPLLIVHGDMDQVAPIEHADRIVKHLPNVRIDRIAGGAHADAHLIDPAAHSSSVREFIVHSLARAGA